MKAKELFAKTDVKYPFGNIDFSGVASDSRRAGEGYLFICQRGLRHDGHYHSLEAVRNGAKAVLAEHEIEGIPLEMTALTGNTRRTESQVWYNFTGRPTDGMTKIAITGTAGKTSVAFTLRHILSSAGRRVGMITTVKTTAGDKEIHLGENGGSSVADIHGAMTTPDPEYFFGAALEMKNRGCDTLIYEASSQSLELEKTYAVIPDVAVFTNLSPEHLDCHINMESYFRAKAMLAERAKTLIVNTDDPWMARLVEMYSDREVIRCSGKYDKVGESEVCALRYVPHGEAGLEFVYFSESAVFRIKTPLVGRHSVYNAMEAAACAIRLGVDPMTVKESLACFRGAPGRLYKIDVPGLNVFIDYAHTPEAIRAVAGFAKELTRGRVILLFGCGGDRDRSKRPDMARAAQELADYVIVTSDNPRNEDPTKIIEDILCGIDTKKPHAVIPDRREAIRHAVKIAEVEDVVLLLGKGHEKYEILSDGKHPFDEESLVREAVADR